MDLTEAEDIKKRWQEYTEELYKKDLHNPDSHDGVTTDLEPDILECEGRWALESITTNKASGGDAPPSVCKSCDPLVASGGRVNPQTDVHHPPLHQLPASEIKQTFLPMNPAC